MAKMAEEAMAHEDREAERLGVKVQIDDLRRRLIMLESRLVSALSMIDTLMKQRGHE